MMYLYDAITSAVDGLEEVQSQMTTEMILMAISSFLIIAAITTTLAACVLVWIAKNENRLEHMRAIWNKRNNKKGNKMVTVPLLLGVVLALSYMSLFVIF